jgi:sugar phosphate isomerase/epimerase
MTASDPSARPHPAVQISTGPFWAFRLERAFDLIAEAGFTRVELMVTRDPMTHQPDAPLELASERGLEITSVHGPFLLVTKSVWGLAPLEKIKRGIDMCRALGASTLVVHPPHPWEIAYADWIVAESKACELATGVTVAVETMYPLWVAGRRVCGYQWLEPWELARHAPRTALDTSHLAVAREDIVDSCDVLADGLAHVHLSNNAGDGHDGHLELDKGVLPIGDLLDLLSRKRYTGGLSLELSVSRYLERPRALVRMLDRNRRLVEDRLARSPVADRQGAEG